MKKEYVDFAKNPENKEAIEKYKKYTKVDAIKGCFTNNYDLVPESFR